MSKERSSYPDSIPLPQAKQARIVIWKDLNLHQLDEIYAAENGDELRACIRRVFALDFAESEPKQAILLDLYFYTLQFCKEQSFTYEQTSALFSIVKETHEMNVETPIDNIEFVLEFFKGMLQCHAVKRPPTSVEVFTPEQLQKAVDFVNETYFPHYKLYKYAFTPSVKMDLAVSYQGDVPGLKEEEPLRLSSALSDLKIERSLLSEEQLIEQLAPATTADAGDDTTVGEEATSAPQDDTEEMNELKRVIADEVNSQIKSLEERILKKIEDADQSIARQFDILREQADAGAATQQQAAGNPDAIAIAAPPPKQPTKTKSSKNRVATK